MYRSLGLQVVPGRTDAKRPLGEWLEFQNALVPEAQFERWFGPQGQHRLLRQMGLLTGACSRAGADPETTEGLFLTDMDVGGPKAKDGLGWWRTFVEVELGGIEPETWTAKS